MTFCSLLLDWIENEKNQDGHGHVMPFSPVMRPSQMLQNQSKNSNSFIDAFMQHLKENERKADTTPTSFATERLENRLPMEPKQPREPKQPKPPKERKQRERKPREPSVKKPRRKKDESNCTTIGLQIQIRDPNTEPEPTIHGDFKSNKITYPFQSDEMDGLTTSNLISNAAENYLPVSTEPGLGTASHTYYNMDSTENEPGEQYLYEPEPVYHVQPMGILSNECGNRSTPVIQSPDINATSLNPYNLYSDQKGNGHPLLSHFNVSHTNVNNSSVVCDTLNNWRAGNEIM